MLIRLSAKQFHASFPDFEEGVLWKLREEYPSLSEIDADVIEETREPVRFYMDGVYVVGSDYVVVPERLKAVSFTFDEDDEAIHFKLKYCKY